MNCDQAKEVGPAKMVGHKIKSSHSNALFKLLGGWSKALLALLAPLKVWHLTKFWDDRG